MASEGSVRDLTDPLYQEYSRTGADTVDEPLSDRAARLPGQRPAPRDLFDELPVHRRRSRHDEQSRGVLPRGSRSSGRPVVDAARDERLAALDRSATTMVNEFRIGYGGAPVIFAAEQFTPEHVERRRSRTRAGTI